MFGEKRKARYLCAQMKTVGCSSALSSSTTGPLPSAGNPKSFSGWLQKEADISCGEKGKLLSSGAGDRGYTGLRTDFCGANGAGKVTA